MSNKLPSFQLDISTLPKSGHTTVLTATNDECVAIAQEYGLQAVNALSGDLQVSHWHRDGFTIGGTIRADIQQQCVISLEPISQTMETEFSAKLVPEGSKLALPESVIDGEMMLNYEADDPPDIFIGRQIDLWEILLEHFALAIDPFPRALGVVMDEISDETPDETPQPSPFAVLESLKTPQK